ncbi:BREX protein BrxB domain-containing protein [Hoyosella altamirensis]|uniref:BREX protein BrxB domain-containing protein n=1 Tax=Hoyosella altamirensis TaxID=616997 RepID=UPI0007DAF3EE|nr:BREX protein BrxB domain-containing protein [Hoyosella altamirensis]
MSRVSDLVDAYAAELSLPWRSGLSGGERVWMLVYPPDMERAIRAALPKLELATGQAGRIWAVIDITDLFGKWLASHRHAESFYENPRDLTPAIVDKFEAELVATIREGLASAPKEGVVALVGIGSIYPFLRSSSVIKKIDGAVCGRLLVLFPGLHDPDTHSFRLLDARDGFDYRARVIDPQKDTA